MREEGRSAASGSRALLPRGSSALSSACLDGSDAWKAASMPVAAARARRSFDPLAKPRLDGSARTIPPSSALLRICARFGVILKEPSNNGTSFISPLFEPSVLQFKARTNPVMSANCTQ